MPVEIEINNNTALCHKGKWKSSNRELENILNIQTSQNNNVYMPHPDLNIADYVISEFGGKITHHDEVEFDPDVVY